MLPSFCNTTITRYRAPLVNSRGTQVRDWEHATYIQITGCSIQRTSETGDLNDRENSQDIYTLYAPYGSDIQQADRVTDGTRTYTVTETPFDWESPTGAVSHLVATLEVWRG